MKKRKSQIPLKPERPLRAMEAHLAKDIELQEAMRLFDIGMKQYARSLSYLSRPQIISRSDTKAC
jgi:hypothetical protein